MQTDVAILSRYFDLEVIVHNRGKMRLAASVWNKLLGRRPHIMLMWFIVPSYALALTLLGRLLRVKVAFITGGYDIAGMPEIGFGALRYPLFRRLLGPTVRLADLVLPFSRSADEQLRRYARPARSVVVYPGIDTDFFTPAPDRHAERERMALTVSPVTHSSMLQKGLKTFVEAARHAPDVQFVLVGRSPDGSISTLRGTAGANVRFEERFVPAEELRDLYRRAACYVQVSLHEGFGIAVAEAMACGAVPVVTGVFSLPEVTGGLGEYVPVNDPAATARAVLRSLDASGERRAQLRQHVLTNFTMERRERELVSALRGLLPRPA